MRNRVMSMMLAATLMGVPALVGCDREVAHETKTVDKSDGTRKVEEKKTVEKADGTRETTTEKKTVDTNR